MIQTATSGAHPLDLSFIDEEDLATRQPGCRRIALANPAFYKAQAMQLSVWTSRG
ncbi:hypothetical protein VB716_07480 [Synechococcus sp. CCY9201]|uniref:hypothetical protein n=1 Tax=Synechococcus sp. CCY9201 TaxID=174697 RepID=UPI002B1EFF96|nr:hypothetical protein [Synechococcus sp. CCY9201]MEA5474064.1 hypothetical protein [Synechococcus sp. CCY9201]